MRGGVRAFVALAFASIFVVPLATAHTLMLHVAFVEIGHVARPEMDPGVGALVLLTLAAALPAGGTFVALVRWQRASRRLQALTAAAVPASLNGLPYYRVPGDTIAVFTAGLRRPRVFVSGTAERALSRPALAAALMHERAHVERGDTRWRAILAAVEGGLAWLPGVRRYLGALAVQSELAADSAAVARGASRLDLFDALVVASTVAGPVASLTGGAVTIRLARLADPAMPERPAPRFGALLIAAWGLVVPLLPHLLLFAGVFGPPHLAH